MRLNAELRFIRGKDALERAGTYKAFEKLLSRCVVVRIIYLLYVYVVKEQILVSVICIEVKIVTLTISKVITKSSFNLSQCKGLKKKNSTILLLFCIKAATK